MPVVQQYTQQIAPTPQSSVVPESAELISLKSNKPVIDLAKGVSDIAVEASNKMREADHVANYAQAQALSTAKTAELEEKFRQDPRNYSKHVDTYTKEMGSLKQEMIKNITDPASANNISASMDKLIQQGAMDVSKQATLQRVDIDTADLTSSANMLYDAGKIDEANALIKQGMETGLFSAVKGQAIIDSKTAETHYMLAEEKVRQYLSAGGDPLKFLEKNPNLNLNMEQRHQITSYAMQLDTWIEGEQAEAKRAKLEEGQKQFYAMFNDNKITVNTAKQMLANGEIDTQDYNYAFRVWESRANEARRERKADIAVQTTAYKEQKRWSQLSKYIELKGKQVNGTLTPNELADAAGQLGTGYYKELAVGALNQGTEQQKKKVKQFNGVVKLRDQQVKTILMHRAGAAKPSDIASLPKEKRDQYYDNMANWYNYAQEQIDKGDLKSAESSINTYINQLSSDAAKQDESKIWNAIKGIDWRGTSIAGINPFSSAPTTSSAPKPNVHIQFNAPSPPTVGTAKLQWSNTKSKPMNSRNAVISWGTNIDAKQFQADE